MTNLLTEFQEDTGVSTMDAPRVPVRDFRYFEDGQVGDTCWTPSFTVTGEVIDAYARLSGDHNPLHVDEEYATASHFGARVAHGLFGLSLTDGLKSQSEYRFHPGASLGWTWDFKAPILIGDTLKAKFWVSEMRLSKSRPGWGVVVLPAHLVNQRGEIVQTGEHRLMIPCRPQEGENHG